MFIEEVLATERAAHALAAAKATGSTSQVRAAAEGGRQCPQILIEAADYLAAHGEREAALDILRHALTLDGPTAPTQHAYSRHCREAGSMDEAARWLRGAMLRGRATATMALELCEIETRMIDGNPDALAELAIELRWTDPPGLKRAAGLLVQSPRPELAAVPLMMLHQRQEDDPATRVSLAELMRRHTPFSGLPASVRRRLDLDDPANIVNTHAASAHDKLAATIPPGFVDTLREREADDRWVPLDRLWRYLRARIEAGDPFSLIRGSDGEGRFAAAMNPELFPDMAAADLAAMLQQIWSCWFGQDIRAVEQVRLEGLVDQVEDAYRAADMLGLTSGAVFDTDRRHWAYRAALEIWAGKIASPGMKMLTEAANLLFVNDRDPFFRELLSGQPFIGVISPHRGLADRLARHIGIPAWAEYLIPGESRLDRAEERANRGEHFPRVFDRLMAEIEVPHRGACFLVAGGILGKVYCARIRRLGGIALDIGAIADAWMGLNTRGKGFERFVQNPLPA